MLGPGPGARWHQEGRAGRLPRAMRSTRMIRMMVGLMGRAAFISISSNVMPMMDSSTMARSSWFHLGAVGGLSAPGTPHTATQADLGEEGCGARPPRPEGPPGPAPAPHTCP